MHSSGKINPDWIFVCIQTGQDTAIQHTFQGDQQPTRVHGGRGGREDELFRKLHVRKLHVRGPGLDLGRAVQGLSTRCNVPGRVQRIVVGHWELRFRNRDRVEAVRSNRDPRKRSWFCQVITTTPEETQIVRSYMLDGISRYNFYWVPLWTLLFSKLQKKKKKKIHIKRSKQCDDSLIRIPLGLGFLCCVVRGPQTKKPCNVGLSIVTDWKNEWHAIYPREN